MTVDPSYTVRLRNHAHDLDADAHLPAVQVPYDNVASGLTAVDAQAAIDELAVAAGSLAQPWFNVEAYGAVHDGTTDDTAAIQAAIDACYAAGGGTVFFPNGIYAIKGALQDTSNFNGQLVLPYLASTGTNRPVSIALVGMGPAAASNVGPTVANLPSQSGVILLSDWAGSISGSPAVVSGGPVAALQTSSGFNWIFVTFRDIEVRTPANPKLTAIQMGAVAGLALDHVTVSTDTASAGMTVPSHTNAEGIRMPNGLNSNWPDHLNDVFIDGYFVGLLPSEQAKGSVAIAHCTHGIRMIGSPGSPVYRRHATHLDEVLLYSCIYGIEFQTDTTWLSIDHLAIEHDPAPFGTIYDVDDGANYARAFIRYHSTDFTTGPDAILVNGGQYVSLHHLNNHYWRLSDTVDIPAAGTNPSTNPATGRRIYTDTSTGHLSARTPAGSVVDLEAPSTSFATPSIALGSSAAAGAASTVIRSDATIAAFDATAPATQAFGDVAAPGSAAKAARRDHVHGMPSTPSSLPTGVAGHGAFYDGSTASWKTAQSPEPLLLEDGSLAVLEDGHVAMSEPLFD